jgi:aminopeptidase YwaD
MDKNDLYEKGLVYLQVLCRDIEDRSVGSAGNRQATKFCERQLFASGWNTATPEFQVMDWRDGGASLKTADIDIEVLVSPYSRGCSVRAPLAGVTHISDLETGHFEDTIILLHGPIAREQLMPKNFVFYNPEEHQTIIRLLEESGAKALICATGRNAAVAGGVYPFPLIEDGDFDIPSVYMTEEEAKRLIPCIGRAIILHSDSQRIPATACNVVGRKGTTGAGRVVVSAHIDAKKGTPGAIDNATGVIALLFLADLLRDYDGKWQIELVAFNGEDYYSAPGQMHYIHTNQENFDNILLNINMDGIGYKEGPTALSFYGLRPSLEQTARKIINAYPGIIEGTPWPQGDHSVFVHYSRPAIAASSHWLIENMSRQTITHTAQDNPDIVDLSKVVQLAEALNELIRKV